VAQTLSVDFADVDPFICCGFPLKNSDFRSSLILGAYNLALARERNLNICALCSSCTSALTEVEHHLSAHEELREEVNGVLSGVGLRYDGPVKVRHFARVLYEDIGPEKIQKHFRKRLDGLTVAVHYGCHYLKPSEIYDHFDEAEDPRTIDTLVSLTGARVLDYPDKKKCCGGPLLPVDENTALAVAREKLDRISVAGADAICLVCPFCAVMYDSNQKSIESAFGVSYKLPVLYLTQILGLAMGFGSKELGLNMNVVKTKHLDL
jgi:heterodisulfide reductase subunit B